MSEQETRDIRKIVELIAAERADERAKVLNEVADLCERMPIDKERCRILLLTEQAWEEGEDACAYAIRKLLEEMKK